MIDREAVYQLIEFWSKDPELCDVPYRRMATEAVKVMSQYLGAGGGSELTLWGCRDENGDLYLYDGPPQQHRDEDGAVYWDSNKFDYIPINIEELPAIPHGESRELIVKVIEDD